MAKPIFSIKINNQPINIDINQYLIQLQLVDKLGLSADQLSLTLADPKGLLSLPEKGVKIDCAIGWDDDNLIDKGSYIVESIEYSGSPDQLSVHAHSVDFCKGIKEKKERSFHKKTLSQILNSLILPYQLTPIIASQYSIIYLDHLDQTNESDIHLLTRLAHQYDAIATVKKGYFFFTPLGQSLSATGRSIAPYILSKNLCQSFQYSQTNRQSHYQGVKTYYQDKLTGKKMAQIAGNPKQLKVLGQIYPTAQEALAAAQSCWQRLQRGRKNLHLILAKANPSIISETPIKICDFKPQLNKINWLVKEVSHNLSGSGFTTQIHLEEKI